MSDATLSPDLMQELLLLRKLRAASCLCNGYYRHRLAYLESCAIANSDIVLVTYATLRKEVGLQSTARRSARQGNTMDRPPVTPLRLFSFRRIIIDEAQQVASSGSSSLGQLMSILSRIDANRRWCVSATPLGDESLRSIQGLVRFLRHPLLGSSQAWRKVAEPFFSMKSVDATSEFLSYLIRPFFFRQDQSVVEHCLPPRHTFVIRVEPTTAEQDRIQELEARAHDIVRWLHRSQLEIQVYRNASGSRKSKPAKRSRILAEAVTMKARRDIQAALGTRPGFELIHARESRLPVELALRKILEFRQRIAYARGDRSH